MCVFARHLFSRGLYPVNACYYSKFRDIQTGFIGMNNSHETENAQLLVKTILETEPPRYTATVPILAYSIRSLGNAFSDLEAQLMPRIIKAKRGRTYEKHLELLRLVLLNLIAVGFSHEQLTIPSTPRPGTYLHDRFGFDQRKRKRIVDALKAHGLMEQVYFGSRGLNIASAFRPTESLLLPYCDFLYSHQGDFDDYSPIRLDGEPHYENVWWYENTERDREILTRYNKYMRDFSWARKGATYRSFGLAPFTASRVHTPYQTIVSRRVNIRKQTLFNGNPIAEPDFSANHLTLLSMIFDERLPESPYDRVAEDTGIKKSIIKLVLVRLMGADGERKYNNAKYSLERDKQNPVSRRGVDAIRASFYKCIPFLKQHNLLCTGMGSKLQFFEGEIAMHMFEWCIETQTPIINVHDAYACEECNEERVERTMYAMREKVINDERLLASCGIRR